MCIAAVEEMPSEVPEDIRERVNQLDVGPVHSVALELYQSNAAPDVWERELRDALRVLDETTGCVARAVEGFDLCVRERVHVAMCAHEMYTQGCASCAVRQTVRLCREFAVSQFESLGTRIAQASLEISLRGRLGPVAKEKSNPTRLAVEALGAGTYAEFMARKGRPSDGMEASAFRWLRDQLEGLLDRRDEDGEHILGEEYVNVELGDARWRSKGGGTGEFMLLRGNGSARPLSARSLLEQLRAKKK